ncbi:Ig-like domain-containing protein [Methylobacterium sp. M6A4_1b]
MTYEGTYTGTIHTYCSEFDYTDPITFKILKDGTIDLPAMQSLNDGTIDSAGRISGISININSLSLGNIKIPYTATDDGVNFSATGKSSNGIISTIQATLVKSNVNHAPEVVDEVRSVAAGLTIKGTAGTTGTGALAHHSDADNDALFVSAIQGGALGQAIAGRYGHLTLNADGSYSYAADTAGSLVGSGHDIFSYRVSDGHGGTATANLDITVQHHVSGQPNEVFRFYDTKTYDHFYTTSVAEKDSIITGVPTLQYEGVQWSTPDKGADTIDVFRFYDTVHGTHFLTTSVGERDSIIANQHTYNYEGVAFQAYKDAATVGTGGLTLERFYNTETGNHHYSASAIETYGINHGSAGANWVDEGPGFTIHVPTAGMLNA